MVSTSDQQVTQAPEKRDIAVVGGGILGLARAREAPLSEVAAFSIVNVAHAPIAPFRVSGL